MNAPAQLDLPALASTIEVNGPDLPGFIRTQQDQGRRVLSMTVIGNARYRLTMADDRAQPSHSLPPVAHRNTGDERTQPTTRLARLRARLTDRPAKASVFPIRNTVPVAEWHSVSMTTPQTTLTKRGT